MRNTPDLIKLVEARNKFKIRIHKFSKQGRFEYRSERFVFYNSFDHSNFEN